MILSLPDRAWMGNFRNSSWSIGHIDKIHLHWPVFVLSSPTDKFANCVARIVIGVKVNGLKNQGSLKACIDNPDTILHPILFSPNFDPKEDFSKHIMDCDPSMHSKSWSWENIWLSICCLVENSGSEANATLVWPKELIKF